MCGTRACFRDEFVYWGCGAGDLTALAGLAGFAEATVEATPTIDGIRACWAHSCVPARDQAAGTAAASGDRVRVEVSPYDLNRGRIVYRDR